jgi:hypothetical protein
MRIILDTHIFLWALGKLQVAFDPVEEAEKCGFEMLDFSGRDAHSGLAGRPFITATRLTGC